MIDNGMVSTHNIYLINSDSSMRQIVIEATRPDGESIPIKFWLSLDGKPTGVNL
jgi:hypothetical protein